MNARLRRFTQSMWGRLRWFVSNRWVLGSFLILNALFLVLALKRIWQGRWDGSAYWALAHGVAITLAALDIYKGKMRSRLEAARGGVAGSDPRSDLR